MSELKKKKPEVEGTKQYRKINQVITKSMRKARATWIEDQCKYIENSLKKNNNRKAYQLVKDLTSVKQGCSSIIQVKGGKCLTEEQDIFKR